jgi:hypothetical protein
MRCRYMPFGAFRLLLSKRRRQRLLTVQGAVGFIGSLDLRGPNHKYS